MDTAGGHTNLEIARVGASSAKTHELPGNEPWTSTFVGHMLFVAGADLHDTAAIGKPAEPCNSFLLACGGRKFHSVAPGAECIAAIKQFFFKVFAG